jgi:quercetin dioxygenase-like cupin family protein
MHEEIGSRVWRALADASIPVLNSGEMEEVATKCELKRQGARPTAPPDERYEVWRIAQVGTAVVELVRLKYSAAYERHVHKNSDSTIQILKGEGHIIFGEGDFVRYRAGNIFDIPKGLAHGFFTIDETYFVSVNNPAIAKGDDVDIVFLENRPRTG